MSHIFISYSKHNRAYARKLADHLLSQGFDVWIDDQIDYGDDWFRTIVRAIKAAKAFVVVMTDEADASDWVQREVTLADKNKIPAFPLWLSGDVDNSDNWAIYVRTQYADVRGEKLPGDDFTRRIERVASRKKVIGQDVTEAPHNSSPEGESTGQKLQSKSKVDTLLEGRLKKIPEQNGSTKVVLPDVTSILPPPFEWCEIPAGRVTIEYSDTHQLFDVPRFWLAKYPITNAQYQVFVDAKDGWRDRKWWSYSEAAKKWRRDNDKPQKTSFEGDKLPQTNVRWYEAMAFCQWLTAKLYPAGTSPLAERQVILTLPTEYEWQRAAQGDDGRRYPWGNYFDADVCNTKEGRARKPTPVDWYSNGMSPYEVNDMAGNVWEMCFVNGTYRLENLVQGGVILRGGSWGRDYQYARTTFRTNIESEMLDGVGFRICCVVPTA